MVQVADLRAALVDHIGCALDRGVAAAEVRGAGAHLGMVGEDHVLAGGFGDGLVGDFGVGEAGTVSSREAFGVDGEVQRTTGDGGGDLRHRHRIRPPTGTISRGPGHIAHALRQRVGDGDGLPLHIDLAMAYIRLIDIGLHLPCGHPCAHGGVGGINIAPLEVLVPRHVAGLLDQVVLLDVVLGAGGRRLVVQLHLCGVVVIAGSGVADGPVGHLHVRGTDGATNVGGILERDVDVLLFVGERVISAFNKGLAAQREHGLLFHVERDARSSAPQAVVDEFDLGGDGALIHQRHLDQRRPFHLAVGGGGVLVDLLGDVRLGIVRLERPLAGATGFALIGRGDRALVGDLVHGGRVIEFGVVTDHILLLTRVLAECVREARGITRDFAGINDLPVVGVNDFERALVVLTAFKRIREDVTAHVRFQVAGVERHFPRDVVRGAGAVFLANHVVAEVRCGVILAGLVGALPSPLCGVLGVIELAASEQRPLRRIAQVGGVGQRVLAGLEVAKRDRGHLPADGHITGGQCRAVERERTVPEYEVAAHRIGDDHVLGI